MKRKYINTQTLLACLSTKRSKKDIHTQLQETIAEHKKLIKQLEERSFIQFNSLFDTQGREAA